MDGPRDCHTEETKEDRDKQIQYDSVYTQNLQKTINTERVWRKGNPLALLMGIQVDTATMENSMEIPLKATNKTTI